MLRHSTLTSACCSGQLSMAHVVLQGPLFAHHRALCYDPAPEEQTGGRGMRQRDVFRGGEGTQWFRRNESALSAEGDPVLRALADIKPKRLLEVGCSNGWRLEEARVRYGSRCTGIDPSLQALTAGS